jgi:predicted ATPase
VLSPHAILARLEARLELLTGGALSSPARHRTLRAAIDWSYDLLEPRERALFRRLAVFAGGCTLEAAEAVCAGDGVEAGEVLELLTRLVDRSLVVAEPSDRATRYRLLETIREYGEQVLRESGEEASLRAPP